VLCLTELARVSSKYIDERRYQIPALGIPLESNILSGFVESYSAIADEFGGGEGGGVRARMCGMLAPKVKWLKGTMKTQS
jgi:hypothetical protein